MVRDYLKFLSVGAMLKGIVPQIAPDDDPLFNRRRLAYFGLAFSIYWVHLILIVYVWGPPPDAVSITAFLSVPATLAGLGFYKYLRAAETDDAVKNGTIGNVGNSNSSVTVTVDNKQPNTNNQGSTSNEPKADGSVGSGDVIERKPD